jgi:L1 cell adhesion molecule like protein
VNCEDNTSLGEFTLSPIPPMKAGDAVLEVVFEVDVNGILKVTATEKTSGRSANITISNSVGKLSSAEIEKMVNDAAEFKTSDEAFTKKFESRQQLESYISRVEDIVSDPTMSMKLKRGQKEKIESALSDAMAQLEIEDSSSDDLKKKELALKRVVTKVSYLDICDSQRIQLTLIPGHVHPLSISCSFPSYFRRWRAERRGTWGERCNERAVRSYFVRG